MILSLPYCQNIIGVYLVSAFDGSNVFDVNFKKTICLKILFWEKSLVNLGDWIIICKGFIVRKRYFIIGLLNPVIHRIRVASVIAFSVCLSVCMFSVCYKFSNSSEATVSLTLKISIS